MSVYWTWRYPYNTYKLSNHTHWNRILCGFFCCCCRVCLCMYVYLCTKNFFYGYVSNIVLLIHITFIVSGIILSSPHVWLHCWILFAPVRCALVLCTYVYNTISSVWQHFEHKIDSCEIAWHAATLMPTTIKYERFVCTSLVSVILGCLWTKINSTIQFSALSTVHICYLSPDSGLLCANFRNILPIAVSK